MTTYTRRVTLVLALAILSACGADRSTAARRYAVLSDGRSDGAPGFYFLPPVAPEPAASAVNDPGLSPVVDIAALDTGARLVRFEGDAVKASDAHYMALWSTKRDPPAAGTTYRISVLLDGKVLGFADAAVARNGRTLRLLGSEGVFGLTGSRTVPIKFRIHGGGAPDLCAGVACPDPTACQASVACDPATGACVPAAKPPGASCDDADPCTADACDGEGNCVSAAVACPGADECNAPSCDPAAGTCVNHPVENGTNCTTATGAAGYCLLDAAQDRSFCMPLGGPGKLAR